MSKFCVPFLVSTVLWKRNLVDVSDIIYFFCSGRGKGEFETPGGDRFFIENPRRGGGSRKGRGRGAGRVSAANWGTFLGRGGLNSFLGAKPSAKAMNVGVRMP